MKISAVANPATDANLRHLAQIGVEDQVFYDMAGMPAELDGLRAAKEKAERNGLRLSVVEGGPKIDRIVLGKEGRDAQIEQYKRSLGHMGKLGVRVLCYNFMPQLTDDAAVFRTSFATPERGGALTSSFDLERFDNDRLTEDGTTTDEQVWDHLDYFLKRIIPAAEDAGVLLADASSPMRNVVFEDVVVTNPGSRPFNACFSAVWLSPNDRTLPPMQLSISTLLVDLGSRDQ